MKDEKEELKKPTQIEEKGQKRFLKKRKKMTVECNQKRKILPRVEQAFLQKRKK